MSELERGSAREDLPLRVLFVCIENSCRSQMAEGFAKARGGARVEARSAGSRPSGRVDPRAMRFMLERGIELSGHESKGLEEFTAGIVWDYIVTMGCGDACPRLPARRRLDWNLPDPKALSDDEFRKVRDRIDVLVRGLLEETIQDGRK